MLDCNTEKGKRYISHQIKCVDKLKEVWNTDIFCTKESQSAHIDAIGIRDDRVSAAIEIKTRNNSLETIKRWGSYMITYEKLVKLCDISKALEVKGFLVVYLIPDDKIMYWNICNEKGEFIVKFTKEITTTQKTCNGGQIDRLNAYISLKSMIPLEKYE